MKRFMLEAATDIDDPQELRREIQETDSRDMRRRKAIVAANLIGLASMGLVSLLQMGMVRRLPEPRVRVLGLPMKTKKVNFSDAAFGYGAPDGTINLVAHSTNIALAAAGDSNRARSRPWIPLALAIASAAQAGVAGKYLFHQMPKVDRAWCPYCVVDAVTHLATFALAMPEALKAFRRRS
ncbi:MAG: vitamin K epoxide reductase family protein [Woeseia sp.]